jgi:pimeloyl-ACP methyl ester carboxylesterase
MLAAEVVGRGDPIVFLHARIADKRMWRAQLDDVGVNNKAISYDRRGFGDTRAEGEDFSALADLAAVIHAFASNVPVILVRCSEGGRLAIDAALRYPSLVRALVLISPSVSGAPEPVYPPVIQGLMSQIQAALEDEDLDRAITLRARLFLDGPFASEGRVTGQARQLFYEMNAMAMRLPPSGSNHDVTSAFVRLNKVSVPTLVICGDLDLPNIQERSGYVARTVPNGSHHALPGAAHLPSLEQPENVTPTGNSTMRMPSGSEPPLAIATKNIAAT